MTRFFTIGVMAAAMAAASVIPASSFERDVGSYEIAQSADFTIGSSARAGTVTSQNTYIYVPPPAPPPKKERPRYKRCRAGDPNPHHPGETCGSSGR